MHRYTCGLDWIPSPHTLIPRILRKKSDSLQPYANGLSPSWITTSQGWTQSPRTPLSLETSTSSLHRLHLLLHLLHFADFISFLKLAAKVS